eukprot:3593446-Rhodomonas_salina.2
MEGACRDHPATRLLKERILSIVAQAQAVGPGNLQATMQEHDAGADPTGMDACLASLEQIATEWAELQQRSEVISSERALFKVARPLFAA